MEMTHHLQQEHLWGPECLESWADRTHTQGLCCPDARWEPQGRGASHVGLLPFCCSVSAACVGNIGAGKGLANAPVGGTG